MGYYFDRETNLESKEVTTRADINGRLYTFKTDNGVFSKKGLDFGTRTLLESLDLDKIKGDVLDLGCGYGPIGIFIASTTDSNVHMIDVNKRSLGLAKKNVELNHVDVKIYESDIYENVREKFDYIITNPPIRVGKKILYQILFDASNYLKEGGHLIFVINKDQGAKSAIKDLKEKYSVEIITKNKGFYIIDCQNY